MTEHLDVDAAAASLGDSHVILLRGHRFHAPGRSRRGVVDVTDHPEINDLVLASDVAVLDYSSLRFDYALTGTADGLPRARPRRLHRRRPRVPLPVHRHRARAAGRARPTRWWSRCATYRHSRRAWAERVRAFDERFNPWQDGHAAERMVDRILSLLT